METCVKLIGPSPITKSIQPIAFATSEVTKAIREASIEEIPSSDGHTELRVTHRQTARRHTSTSETFYGWGEGSQPRSQGPLDA